MKNQKALIQIKIDIIKEKLEALNPFDSPEQMRFYMDRLDEQCCLLARIEIEEEFERMQEEFRRSL